MDSLAAPAVREDQRQRLPPSETSVFIRVHLWLTSSFVGAAVPISFAVFARFASSRFSDAEVDDPALIRAPRPRYAPLPGTGVRERKHAMRLMRAVSDLWWAKLATLCLALALGAGMAMLGGCETGEGVGEDIEHAGEEVGEGVEDVGEEVQDAAD